MTEEQLLQKHERMGQECYVAAAVIGGSALIGGVTSAVGAKSGADAQTNAANQAAALQQQQYQQNRTDQQPYMQAGTTALNQIGQDQANGTGFAAPFTQSSFMSDPGYQFQLQQGQNAINSSAAATGGVLNGGTLKALDQYTTGLANTTYGDAYNRYLATSQQQYGQLANIAQLGENATASTGAQGTAAANASGNYLTQAGNATAAGDVGVGNAINGAVGTIANAGTTSILANALQSSQSGYGNLNLNGTHNFNNFAT